MEYRWEHTYGLLVRTFMFNKVSQMNIEKFLDVTLLSSEGFPNVSATGANSGHANDRSI